MKAEIRRRPLRTCVACRQTREKKDLIRLVSTNNDGAEIDMIGKQPGRGAYLCPRRACWELALKKNRLEHALRTKLRDDSRECLREYAHTLEEN